MKLIELFLAPIAISPGAVTGIIVGIVILFIIFALSFRLVTQTKDSSC
jgi:hypothetical protein